MVLESKSDSTLNDVSVSDPSPKGFQQLAGDLSGGVAALNHRQLLESFQDYPSARSESIKQQPSRFREEPVNLCLTTPRTNELDQQ
jgi:hypothetical protein